MHHLSKIKFFILFNIFFFNCNHVFAVALSASYNGSFVEWTNANRQKSLLVPTTWDIHSSLETTSNWTPGMYFNSQNMIVFPGLSMGIPINIEGIEYNLSSAKFSLHNKGSSCGNESMVGASIVRFMANSGCQSGYNFVSNLRQAPFYFTRPIIKIDESLLISQFEKDGMREGVYTGTIDLTFNYYYTSETGNNTYRQIKNSLTMIFNYRPSKIIDVTVSGNGIAEPKYDKTSRKISGENYYDISINGNFENGIIVEFPNRDYNFSNADSRIPYSISCVGLCSENIIVEDGKLINKESKISEGVSNKMINFRLRYFYENITADSVNSGSHTDAFSILLRANI